MESRLSIWESRQRQGPEKGRRRWIDSLSVSQLRFRGLLLYILFIHYIYWNTFAWLLLFVNTTIGQTFILGVAKMLWYVLGFKQGLFANGAWSTPSHFGLYPKCFTSSSMREKNCQFTELKLLFQGWRREELGHLGLAIWTLWPLPSQVESAYKHQERYPHVLYLHLLSSISTITFEHYDHCLVRLKAPTSIRKDIPYTKTMLFYHINCVHQVLGGKCHVKFAVKKCK